MLYFAKIGYPEGTWIEENILPDKEWLQGALGVSICPQCKCINRSRYPEPIKPVVENAPQEQTSAWLENTFITMWRRDFIEYISDYMKDFIIGDCYFSDKSRMEDFVTCYSANPIIIRGNKKSQYTICPGCRTITSKVKPGPQYVLQRNLNDAKVYQDAYCQFYFSEDIAFGLDFNQWDDIGLEAIFIRELPADGQKLPGD